MVGNAMRPIMSYGTKNDRASRKSFLYVEAIRKFQKECRNVDFSEAYKKARPNFVGRMETNFIVLLDKEGEETVVSGSNAVPLAERMETSN